MKRALAVALLAAAVAAAAAPAARAPSRVQVVADEFDLDQSRYTLRAGPAIIELVNSGEDDHDLALRRRAPGARTYKIPTVLPGKLARLRATLAPGRYVLWCTIADHRELGMETRLTVVRPRR